MATPAQRVANARYIATLGQIEIRPYKAEAETIKAAAAEAGQSVQAYILQAVREHMERDKAAREG